LFLIRRECSMYAVIGIGGKQVRVRPGETVRVETLRLDPGTSVTFDRVLMVGGEQGTLVGTPVVAGAKVLATVLEHDRAKKILIFKKKRRKQYRRTNGHRQSYTAVRIDEIETSGERHAQENAGKTEAGERHARETAGRAETDERPVDVEASADTIDETRDETDTETEA
jgi:large subunit ribosomal protein L21